MNLFIMAKIFCKKKKTKIFSLNISIYDYFYAKKKTISTTTAPLLINSPNVESVFGRGIVFLCINLRVDHVVRVVNA